MSASAIVRAALIAAFAAGCGALGGGGGGGENLPNRGIVPYRALEGSPRFVLEPGEDMSYGHPSAVAVNGEVWLFFSAGARILRAKSSDGERFGAPEVAVDPAEGPAWLEGRADAPSAVLEDGTLHLVFEAGQGRAIAHAVLSGTGAAIDDEPLLEPREAFELGGVGAPSLVFDGGRASVYYTARDSLGALRIARASLDGAMRPVGRAVVLSPGEACAGTDGAPGDCWDGDGVGDPEVRRAMGALGRTVFRLFYTGLVGTERGLGFAASYDGESFARFETNPILAEEGVLSTAPTNLFDDARGRYLLYFREEGEAGEGIRLFVNGEGRASERF